jgi:hypothetical protein
MGCHPTLVTSPVTLHESLTVLLRRDLEGGGLSVCKFGRYGLEEYLEVKSLQLTT